MVIRPRWPSSRCRRPGCRRASRSRSGRRAAGRKERERRVRTRRVRAARGSEGLATPGTGISGRLWRDASARGPHLLGGPSRTGGPRSQARATPMPIRIARGVRGGGWPESDLDELFHAGEPEPPSIRQNRFICLQRLPRGVSAKLDFAPTSPAARNSDSRVVYKIGRDCRFSPWINPIGSSN